MAQLNTTIFTKTNWIALNVEKKIEPTNISRPKRGRKAGVNVATTPTKAVKENDELKDLIDETDDNTAPSDEDDNDNLAEDISLDISKDKSDDETV